jgi:repressor LexA
MDLSPRQQEVLAFIEGFLSLEGYPPTLREIGRALGIKSTNAVNDHLKALETKGAIVRSRARSRGIAMADREGTEAPVVEGAVAVPLLGRIAAGVPLLAEENVHRMVHVDRSLAPRDEALFALTVVGDSMVDAGIFDGDVIVVRPHPGEPPSGTIVVALLDGEATVKRFFRDGDVIRLQPENQTMQPIFVRPEEGRDTLIQGRVISVLRQLI